MAWQYSEKTKILFMNAINGAEGSHFGEIPDPDGVGEHGSISCGDAMRFFIKVRRGATPLEDVIVDAKYSTFGCTSAIASSEALCELLIKGTYTPIEALSIKNDDIVQFLGGLPSQKIHCSVMGAEALEAAVADWAERRGVDLAAMGIQISSLEDEESPLVCTCYNITKADLRRKIVELNLMTIEDVTGATKAGAACGACHHAPGGIQDTLDEIWGKNAELKAQQEAQVRGDTQKPKLSAYQLSKRIETILDANVRPMLAEDGGDLEIIDIKDNLVFIALTGNCIGCPGASSTIQDVVEKNLREGVDPSLRVISI